MKRIARRGVRLLAGVAFVASAATADAASLGQMAGHNAVLDIFQMSPWISLILYLAAGAFSILGVSALIALRRPNHSHGMPSVIVPFLAAIIAAAMPSLMFGGSQTLTGGAPGIDANTATAPIQWQQ